MRRMFVIVSILFLAKHSEAIPVTVVDLDTVTLGSSVAGPLTAPFNTAAPPPETNGVLTSEVFTMNGNFAYVHNITPLNITVDSPTWTTEFDVRGFTGIGGWSFSDAVAAGGDGNSLDFAALHSDLSGRMAFVSRLEDEIGSGWNVGEPITFFFISTLPPGMGDYNLINSEAGTASTFAPVPEPGTIALFASGLAGLYARYRRKKSHL